MLESVNRGETSMAPQGDSCMCVYSKNQKWKRMVEIRRSLREVKVRLKEKTRRHVDIINEI